MSICNEIHLTKESYTITALITPTKTETNRASSDISAVISSPATGNRPQVGAQLVVNHKNDPFQSDDAKTRNRKRGVIITINGQETGKSVIITTIKPACN